MEVWKIMFLSKWVICRFQPLIFQGVPTLSNAYVSMPDFYHSGLNRFWHVGPTSRLFLWSMFKPRRLWWFLAWLTLRETNSKFAPKNDGFQARNLLFQGATIFRGSVSFREGIFWEYWWSIWLTAGGWSRFLWQELMAIQFMFWRFFLDLLQVFFAVTALL